MVADVASLELKIPTSARIANRGISQPRKTHSLAPSVLWVILPIINGPGKHKLGTIGAKRAQEVLLVLRPEPTMPAKAVANVPVVPIPKWKL